MAASITAHLEQIQSCSRSIAELPFPGPARFTNALLAPHDITALIRDTESHERALYHLAPPPLPATVGNKSEGVAPISSAALKIRRLTVHPSRHPKSKAVAAVLGGDLYAKISSARQAGDPDVDLLLQGAERLATIYPIPGALERIAQLKKRHVQLQANITHYEGRVAEQSLELEKMRGESSPGTQMDQIEDGNDEAGLVASAHAPTTMASDKDWADIQHDIDELEQKKKNLESRVYGIEKDLEGLLR